MGLFFVCVGEQREGLKKISKRIKNEIRLLGTSDNLLLATKIGLKIILMSTSLLLKPKYTT